MRAGFAALLIPDEVGRRAFDESVADWREERAKAESPVGRLSADISGAAALVRVFVLIGGAGLRQPEVWRFAFFTGVAAATVMAVQIVWISHSWGLTAGDALLRIPKALPVFGAVAAGFGFGLRSGRPFPGLTLAGGALLLMLLNASVFIPQVGQYYENLNAARRSGSERAAQAQGVAQMSPADRLRRAMTEDRSRRELVMTLSVALAAPTLLLLGAALRAQIARRWSWRVSKWAGGFLALGLFVSAGTAGIGLAELALATGISRHRSDLEILAWWTAIVVSLLVTLWLSRRTSADAANLSGDSGTSSAAG